MIGLNPKIIQIYYEKDITGYACVNYDSCYDNYLRLHLSHFSALNYDKFPEVFEKFLEYLNKNMIFDEIIINLYYTNKVYLYILIKLK